MEETLKKEMVSNLRRNFEVLGLEAIVELR